MRKSVLIILFFLYSFCLSQNNVPTRYKGEIINTFDSLNLKQGKWLEFKNNDTTDLEYSEGYYTYNKKSGIWEIHKVNFDTRGTIKVKYYENGWFSIENTQRVGFNCNQDSSLIYFLKNTKTNNIKLLAYKDGKGFYQVVIYNKTGEIISKKENVDFYDLIEIIDRL